MFVIKFRKVFYAISVIMIALSAYSVFVYGLNLGIDFKGGSILEVEYSITPDTGVISQQVASLKIGTFSLRQTGDNGIILRTRTLTEPERVALTSEIVKGDVAASIKRFDSVGPVLGEELRNKAFMSMVYVILAIIIFITFVFRKVSKPVASWKYGVVAIVALLHDVIVPVGVFAYLGHFQGVEIDSLFVTALLVILGFSIHDTIVVFDRTRENLHKNEKEKIKKSYEEVVGNSISQTFTRSINTSLTTLISLAVLYYFGPETTKHFSLALLIGITVGTYSSIFIGSPLLVTLEKLQEKK